MDYAIYIEHMFVNRYQELFTIEDFTTLDHGIPFPEFLNFDAHDRLLASLDPRDIMKERASTRGKVGQRVCNSATAKGKGKSRSSGKHTMNNLGHSRELRSTSSKCINNIGHDADNSLELTSDSVNCVDNVVSECLNIYIENSSEEDFPNSSVELDEEPSTSFQCMNSIDNGNEDYLNSADGQISVDALADDIAMPGINRDNSTECLIEKLFKADVTLETVDDVVDSTTEQDFSQDKVKKKRRRERYEATPVATLLPPCKICGEKSSGYHYGVNTCEACKGFFRRTLKKKEVRYKCKCKQNERAKWGRGPFRNGCPACRYERCLDVGMSKNAIKIGRYTIHHKTSNITEAKRLEHTLKRKREEAVTIEEIAADVLKVEHLIESNMCQSSPTSSSSLTVDSGIESPGDLSVPSNPDILDLTSYSTTPSPLPSDHPTFKKRFTESMPGYLKSGLTLQEIDTIVKTMTEAHKNTQFMDDRPVQKCQQQHNEYAEKYKRKKQLFGELNSITKAEFLEFYKQTGIDIDGRFEEVKEFLKFFEKKIAVIVAFAKAIPGFKQLCLDDQAALVKTSRMENILMAGYKMMARNCDIENEVLITPWGQSYHFEEMGRLLSFDFLYHKFIFSKRIKDMDLSLHEEAIIRAILITSSDRCDLKEPDKVAAMQEKMIFCLQHLLNVRHAGPGKMLYKVFDLMTDLRVLVEKENGFAKEMLTEPLVSKQLSTHYTLIKEFLS